MALLPGEGKRDIADGAVAGLVLRISPNGSRHWLFRYTWKKARPRIALGQFPAVGLAEARKLALECNEWLERGVDPRRAARWQGRDARTIKPGEVIDLLDEIVGRGSPVQANRTATYIGQMFKFGIHCAIVDDSPVKLLYKPGGKDKPRDRAFSEDEMQAFVHGHTVACVTAQRAHCLMFLLLSLQRGSELSLATRRYLALEQLGDYRNRETRRTFLTTAVTAVGMTTTPDPTESRPPRAASQDTMISTRLTDRFGIKHPIVCAPMALITGGELAVAVSRAGGLGIVGGGYAGTLGGEPDLEAELARAKASKFGVGFITHALARAPTMLTKALKHSPCCVFLSFGDPRPFAAEIRDAGAALICQVQFLSQIEIALEAGAAAIVAQGTEAGGHGGNRSTLPFVPEAADYLRQRSPNTLLIAAGGIADGRGLAAALMLGADGVVVGTRLWASAEALTPKAHTDKAIGKSGDSTIRARALDALRGVPWPKEYSLRFLRNKLADEWVDRESEALGSFGLLSTKYAQARAQNDLDAVAVICGEAVGLLKDRPSAESIVKSMAAQAAELLRNGSTLKFTAPSRAS